MPYTNKDCVHYKATPPQCVPTGDDIEAALFGGNYIREQLSFASRSRY